MAWSPYGADLFALTTDQGVRRLTNSPSYAEIANGALPTGGVTLKVRNLNAYRIGPISIHVQGTRVLGSLSLGPHGEGAVTLPQVADLGAGVLQTISARLDTRTTIAAVGVDVRAGSTVTVSGALAIGTPVDQQATQPAFHHTGRHVVLSLGGLRTLPVEGGVPSTAHMGNLLGSSPAYAPADGRVLYVGMGGIWLLRPGEAQARKVVSHPSGGLADGPAWLPDGSGFVYTAATQHPTLQTASTQIFLRRFAEGSPRQLTATFGMAAADLVVSPDGAFVAFRRAGSSRLHGDLWILPIGAPSRMWRVTRGENARHGAWR